jgi:YbbR domain-containing protein
MTAFLRNLFLQDIMLKLFSLGLAVLIWLTLSFTIQREGGPVLPSAINPQITLTNLRVLVMSSAQDTHMFQVMPKTVDVIVQAPATLLTSLHANDIRVIVDLTDVEAGSALRKRVEVFPPPGISVLNIEPDEVQVVVPAKP